MKNAYLIRDLGPNLLHDHSQRPHLGFWSNLFHSIPFWVTLLGLLSWIGFGVTHAESTASDPMVMKVYPDGTKVVVRWSDVGKKVDMGEAFGGSPQILPYDPEKDGVVPIGTGSQSPDAKTTNQAVPAATSVVSPDSPKMDYTNADPKDYENNYGSTEGFVFRTAVGPSFQQPLSGRTANGTDYTRMVFQPGIRYDLEFGYNVNEWFRIGMETAFLYNQLHSFQYNNSTHIAGGSVLGNGGYFQVPVLASATFHFPTEGPIRGYFGGGAGATWDILQYSAGGNSPYTSYQWNYAWQVTAGFTYNVAPGLDLDIGYKLLSNPSPNFRNSSAFKASYNHAAELGLVWRY